MSAVYDQKKIDALASELMEPQRLAGGGAIRKAADAINAINVQGVDVPVREPSDNINNVMRSNFQYPKIIGNQTLSIDNISGGVRFDPNERRRVDDLSAKILGENGFISRIIVDQDNNVIEGQHRLEALRQLGANEVPVYKIEDLSSTLPVIEMENAINSAGKIHPDHTNQIIQYALENIAQHGLDGARDFNFGKYQNHYDAALKAASTTVAPEGMSKGGLVDKLRSAASSVKEAGNVYRAAVGNMFSPFEPREERLPGLYPSDWEYPELRLRRPGIVNLAIGMPNMFADMRDLFGSVKDAASGDEVPDEQWPRWDKATEAQGRYEEDMDTFLRSYTGKSVDELSAPMSAVLGVSEALAQPGIISARAVEKLPRLARYLSNITEFATPVTVASPGAMTTGAVFNAGIRTLPALTDDDELKQIYNSYLDQDLPNKTGRDLTGREQARLNKYLQELLGKKDGGLIDRINQSFYENISKPAVGTAIDMTLGLGDLAQMGARYLGNRMGMDAGEFKSVAQPAKEALGVEGYNPYTVGGIGASVLPFAAAGRTAQAVTSAPTAARQLQGMFPNLGRESGAYVGGETAAAAAREIAPESTAAELLASAVGSMGGGSALGQPTQLGIIKERGGNWLDKSIDDQLENLRTQKVKGVYTPAYLLEQMIADYPPETLASLALSNPERLRIVTNSIDRLKRESQIDNWIDTKLSKYIRNEMATQSDPIRLYAESFQAEKAEKLARKDEQIARAMDNLERTRLERGVTANDLTRSQAQIRELQRERALIAAQTGLHVNPDEVGINRYLAEDIRRGQGYPQLGASRTAQAWEDASDVAVFPSTAGTHLTYSADSVLDDNPWLAKIPPESKTYEMRQTGFAHNFRGLGFDHMMDELRNATAPNSDLPENLRIKPSDLSQMSVPEIVKKIDEINAWRNVNRSEVDAARANNAATVPFKEYDAVPYRGKPNTEGLKWVQLARTGDTPEADAALNDALEYEGNIMNHSVGGYRTPDRGGSQDYGLGGWDAITSGRARIYSLRDANGKPHATIEVLSNPVRYNDIVREVGIKTASEMSNRGMTVAQMAQAIPNFKMPARITQIKGLNNKIPEEQYLPFVQDFVRSQEWSDIGDVHHTGLTKLYSDSDLAKAMRDAGQTPPEYVTNEELTQLRKQYPTGYATGGLVYDADAINALANELMEPVKLAEGGPPPRSRIAKAAATFREATTPPREVPDEQRVSDDDFATIARDLGVDVDETDVLTDMPIPSMARYTAADRAAAGNRAASLISTQHPIKASEALGRLMEQGFRRTATTQADRTIVGDGNIGGPNFPVLGMVDPEYAGRSWGVMNQGTATNLMRQSSPQTAWTTLLGSADQLKSNQLVFDELQDAFVSSMRQGNLTPELESKYNQNLRLIFGEDADIRDPEIWSRANTFAKRAAFADILMGKGLGGEKSGRGVIFNPSEILKRRTEPSLLHPSQGGTVPTYALGPRMFTIEDSADYRPDLHPGFPMLLKGRDLGLNVIPTPTEVYLPDWHRNFREVMAQKTPPRKAPAGRYDLASGLKGQGLPSQELTDDYIRHLIREGFSQGGLANYRDMIRSN